jgi:hypothetical protein
MLYPQFVSSRWRQRVDNVGRWTAGIQDVTVGFAGLRLGLPSSPWEWDSVVLASFCRGGSNFGACRVAPNDETADPARKIPGRQTQSWNCGT